MPRPTNAWAPVSVPTRNAKSSRHLRGKYRGEVAVRRLGSVRIGLNASEKFLFPNFLRVRLDTSRIICSIFVLQRKSERMRKRGQSSPFSSGYGTTPHSIGSDPPANHHDPRVLKISPVPKEWTEQAAQPWRILFPDLEWTPPIRRDK